MQKASWQLKLNRKATDFNEKHRNLISLRPLPFCQSWSVSLQVIETDWQMAGQARNMTAQALFSQAKGHD